MLHPSRLVTATMQVPLISQNSKWRPCSKSSGGRMAQHQRVEEQLQIQNARSEPTSPIGMLQAAQQVTPPPRFWGVMVCFWRDPLLVAAYEAPLAAGSSGGAYYGNDEHQLHHEGQGHWDNLYGHCKHFCGASGPQRPQPGDPSHRTHH